jgi:hypothetical protein
VHIIAESRSADALVDALVEYVETGVTHNLEEER